MKTTLLAAAAVAAMATTAADAATFTYLQSYSDGALLELTFEADDLNGDNLIVSFMGEVTNFSGIFSGNSIIPTLSFDVGGLAGLVLHLDQPAVLGDDSFGALEGLRINDTTGLFVASVGQGPSVGPCDGVGECGVISGENASGTFVFDTTTSQLQSVGNPPMPAVPLPASGLLLAGALAFGAGAARRRK